MYTYIYVANMYSKQTTAFQMLHRHRCPGTLQLFPNASHNFCLLRVAAFF